jgi:hypothetical protein
LARTGALVSGSLTSGSLTSGAAGVASPLAALRCTNPCGPSLTFATGGTTRQTPSHPDKARETIYLPQQEQRVL